jgi:hypothetical protein
VDLFKGCIPSFIGIFPAIIEFDFGCLGL